MLVLMGDCLSWMTFFQRFEVPGTKGVDQVNGGKMEAYRSENSDDRVYGTYTGFRAPVRRNLPLTGFVLLMSFGLICDTNVSASTQACHMCPAYGLTCLCQKKRQKKAHGSREADRSIPGPITAST